MNLQSSMNKITICSQAHTQTPLQVKYGEGKRDKFYSGHAYKCLPLTEANRYGYDLYVDEDIDVEWNGGPAKDDIIVHSGPVIPHFGIGTFTLDGDGDIWRVPDGYDLMVIPVPNSDHIDKFTSLTAIIEADWLSYPWFLSIRLTSPGRILITAGTPLARVFAFKRLEDYSLPEVYSYDQEAPMNQEREIWENERSERNVEGSTAREHALYRKNMQRRIKFPKE